MKKFDSVMLLFRLYAVCACIVTMPVVLYSMTIYVAINIYILVLYVVGEVAVGIKPKAARRRKKRRSNKPAPASAAG